MYIIKVLHRIEDEKGLNVQGRVNKKIETTTSLGHCLLNQVYQFAIINISYLISLNTNKTADLIFRTFLQHTKSYFLKISIIITVNTQLTSTVTLLSIIFAKVQCQNHYPVYI